MKIEQSRRTDDGIWEYSVVNELKNPLVFVFGDRILLEDPGVYDEIKHFYPDGHIIFGSTSGEILGVNVYEKNISVTAIEFNNTEFDVVNENVSNHDSIESLGNALSKKLKKEKLKHVFIVSDGSFINGTDLINGLELENLTKVAITGGLCGDGSRFEKTLASYNENPRQGEVIAVGFYGDTFEITYGYEGGWTTFGPERVITKSVGNILYEIDNQPALELYKKYLGDKAADLPEAALLFPLSMKLSEDEEPLVRTILSIDESTNSMVLAGDMPVNARVQLMMSTTDDIAEGARKAAEMAMKERKNSPELAILVSCVGRRLVLDQRTEEEVEEVMNTIGEQAIISGFYSYGEMAPSKSGHACQLHNQTMTLTLLSE